jgi:hypothetical protein
MSRAKNVLTREGNSFVNTASLIKSVLLTFRFFPLQRFSANDAAESAAYSRAGYPAQTTVFLASLATLREMVFVRTVWNSPEPEKARTPRRQAAKKSDQVPLTLCEKCILGCGSAALGVSVFIRGQNIGTR